MKNNSLVHFAIGLLAVFVSCAIAQSNNAQVATLSIDTAKPVAKVSPMLYGLMTEEINYSYDGGLYAELIRNRSFQDDVTKPAYWSVVQDAAQDKPDGTIVLDNKQPLNDALPVSLRLTSRATETRRVGIANDGFWGIPVKPSTIYRASFYAKSDGSFTGPLTVSIESNEGGKIFAEAIVPKVTNTWQKYSVTLTTDSSATPSTTNRFVISAKTPGTIWFNLVSLFPPTFKNRPNGLRADLMQMLVDLKPAFLRFPGGNYLEGDTIATRFDWKKTLGPISERAGHPGPWKYRSSDGMGLLEFLEWCEDMNAEPVLAVYAGYSLNGEFVKPGPDLEPYIQDAFDEVEYITGPVTSKWGAQRAKNGHPAPFKLSYIEVGNEDFFDKSGTYDGRFAQFHDAFQKKHPLLKLISTVGKEQSKQRRVHSRTPAVLDEHYYRSVDAFLKMAPAHYESYPRNGQEIFVGEWAAYETQFPPWNDRSKSEARTPNLRAALGDAAWMTAMERNSDIVTMQCYAPLLVNVNEGASQWRPNLIGYDALRSYGSPSYYAIGMFSRHVGDQILKAVASNTSLHYSVTRDSKTSTIYLKIVNATDAPQPLALTITGADSLAPTAIAITLTSAQITDTNSLDEPTKVIPITTQVTDIKPSFSYTFPASSITVLELHSTR